MKMTTGMIAILVTAVVVLMLGVLVIIVTGRDPSSYVFSIGGIFTSIAGFLVTVRGLRRQSANIEVVRKQTNGTLTKLLVEKYLAEEQARQALAKLHPVEAQSILDATMSRDEVFNIVQANNQKLGETVGEAKP